jgi:hypothetical protein
VPDARPPQTRRCRRLGAGRSTRSQRERPSCLHPTVRVFSRSCEARRSPHRLHSRSLMRKICFVLLPFKLAVGAQSSFLDRVRPGLALPRHGPPRSSTSTTAPTARPVNSRFRKSERKSYSPNGFRVTSAPSKCSCGVVRRSPIEAALRPTLVKGECRSCPQRAAETAAIPPGHLRKTSEQSPVGHYVSRSRVPGHRSEESGTSLPCARESL